MSINIKSSLLHRLSCCANSSAVSYRLAAAVVHKNKPLTDTFCNIDRNYYRGICMASLHAETRALLNYYGRSVFFHPKRGWCLLRDKKVFKGEKNRFGCDKT